MNAPKEKPPRGGKGLSIELAKASQSDGRTSSSIVDELRDLLGDDVVLLPIKRGDKKPLERDWQTFTPARMQDAKYLARLNHDANIGVLLGKGLTTIDIDSDAAVEPFLVRNPKLRATLRTKRVRGCNLWLRIKGDYPKSCKLRTRSGEDWGEWRADGNQTVIHGEAIDRKKGETEPTAYRIINRVKPVELAFDEIQWPAELVLPWASAPLSSNGAKSLDDLRRLYGKPFYFDKDGCPCSLNESFWAGLFASENIILWEPLERTFYPTTKRPVFTRKSRWM